eukprot:4926739-Pleurochrysis_carterae.AAC.1
MRAGAHARTQELTHARTHARLSASYGVPHALSLAPSLLLSPPPFSFAFRATLLFLCPPLYEYIAQTWPRESLTSSLQFGHACFTPIMRSPGLFRGKVEAAWPSESDA